MGTDSSMSYPLLHDSSQCHFRSSAVLAPVYLSIAPKLSVTKVRTAMGKLKSLFFGKVLSTGVLSTEKSRDPSSAGPSALSAQNLANSSVTAQQLAEYLGEDIDLSELNSVSEAEHERLRQLKTLGEQWGERSRINVRAPGVREWHAEPDTAQLVQIACHASNAVRPKPSSAPPKPPGTEEFSKIESISSALSGMVKKGISVYYCETVGMRVVVVCVRAARRLGDWVINGGFRMLDVDRDFIVSLE
jgi:hypothetical protein